MKTAFVITVLVIVIVFAFLASWNAVRYILRQQRAEQYERNKMQIRQILNEIKTEDARTAQWKDRWGKKNAAAELDEVFNYMRQQLDDLVLCMYEQNETLKLLKKIYSNTEDCGNQCKDGNSQRP